MPVLETVAAVATIIGAFQTAAGLYTGWKARKEATERARGELRPIAKDSDTQALLVLGRRRVQEAYDQAFSALGARFARGDGEGRAQLQDEIILLQQTVIALLQNANNSHRGALEVTRLVARLEARRVGVVQILTSQYQRMSVAAPVRSSLIGELRSDYFASASNLHVKQMGRRCPTSLFKGIATLTGYRWQINERGFANVVPSPDDQVEGLVYSVSYKDQLNLNRYEGVEKGFYECRPLSLRLAECVDAPWKTNYVVRQLAAGHAPKSATKMKDIDALVYVSSTYVTEGRIRAEYVDRMKLGMADGIALGISEQYMRRYLEPYITVGKGKGSKLDAPAQGSGRRPSIV